MYKTIIKSRIVSNALALDKQFIEDYSKEENFDFPKRFARKKYIITSLMKAGEVF